MQIDPVAILILMSRLQGENAQLQAQIGAMNARLGELEEERAASEAAKKAATPKEKG
jgi:hypothetical protein